jgi:hypothetical protein
MRYDKEFTKKDGRILRAGGPRDLQRRQNQPGDQSELVAELRKVIENLRKELDRKPRVEGAFSAEEVDEEIRKAVAQTVKEVKAASKKTINDLRKNNEILNNKLTNSEEREKKLLKEIENVNKAHKKEIEDVVKNEAEKYTRVIEQVDEGYKKTIEHLEKSIKMLEDRHESEKEFLDLLESGSIYSKDADINAKLDMLMEKVGVTDVDTDPERPRLEKIFIDPLDEKAGQGLESHIIVDEDIRSDKDEKMDDKVDKLKRLMKGLPKI